MGLRCFVLPLALWVWCESQVTVVCADESPSGADAAVALEKAFVDVIGRTEKSVVAIARVRREPNGEATSLDIRPDAFGRRTSPAVSPQPTDPDFIPNEYATGVVIDPHGLILTAYHVLDVWQAGNRGLVGESDYYVTTADRKVFKAAVKAADPRSDLAVLSIDAANLTAITFGNAADLKKGQIVINLGNPHAIARDGQASAAWGIVANLARKAPAAPSASDPSGRSTLHHHGTLIQTDAKLNVGVSGGPLLNLRGEMVGLAVALPAAVGFETAAGYAYPVDATFRRVVETLKQGREVDYGFLGVLPGNQAADSNAPRGVRVSQVVPGTPAAHSGLKVDDIVTAVDNMPVADVDGFYLEVGRQPAEAVARLDVVRDGQSRKVEVVLAKYPVRGRKIVTVRDPDWRGLRVDYPTAVVDSDGQPRNNAAMADRAVAAAEVREGSPAWQAGLREGLLISHVGQTSVHTPKEFAAAVAGKGDAVSLRILGDEKNPVHMVSPDP
jgi:S1-C subfamily serine protease